MQFKSDNQICLDLLIFGKYKEINNLTLPEGGFQISI